MNQSKFNDESRFRSARSGGRGVSRSKILYWRKSLWDPDRFFDWLAPKVRFFWSGGFLLFSAGCILLAGFIVWANATAVAGALENAIRWETVFWTWLILLGVTTLHECAHGLTCKHFGGEVHEIGFLLMFFMPCFYCNVSDAWLFREKSRQLWVTFAGGYFELFIWALAVFLWRITVPGSLPNYLAFVVLASCGIQSFFNFNPLIKLDGYYLLSDWLEIPNLRRRALERIKSHLRRWLWGAEQPPETERGRVLAGFGIASWRLTTGSAVRARSARSPAPRSARRWRASSVKSVSSRETASPPARPWPGWRFRTWRAGSHRSAHR